nr:unnamed protein product [Digitaria exilis]
MGSWRPRLPGFHKVVEGLATTSMDKVLCLNLAEQCHSSGGLLQGIWVMVRLTEKCNHHKTMVVVEVDTGQVHPP